MPRKWKLVPTDLGKTWILVILTQNIYFFLITVPRTTIFEILLK